MSSKRNTRQRISWYITTLYLYLVFLVLPLVVGPDQSGFPAVQCQTQNVYVFRKEIPAETPEPAQFLTLNSVAISFIPKKDRLMRVFQKSIHVGLYDISK
jgi:hypothetical protein